MLTHSFPVPPTWFQYFSDFQLEKHLTRPQTQPNIFICLLDHADEAPLGNIKIKRQWWPAKPLISGRSGTHYVAMVKMLISSYCEAHLVESFCKKSNISDTNWLSYLYSSYLIKILLSIWRHHLANLRFLKTWISLEQKERFENSKRHSSSRTGYLFIFWNGLDRKDVNFVIVAL